MRRNNTTVVNLREKSARLNSTWEVEAGEPRVQGHPQLHGETEIR